MSKHDDEFQRIFGQLQVDTDLAAALTERNTNIATDITIEKKQALDAIQENSQHSMMMQAEVVVSQRNREDAVAELALKNIGLLDQTEKGLLRLDELQNAGFLDSILNQFKSIIDKDYDPQAVAQNILIDTKMMGINEGKKAVADTLHSQRLATIDAESNLVTQRTKNEILDVTNLRADISDSQSAIVAARTSRVNAIPRATIPQLQEARSQGLLTTQTVEDEIRRRQAVIDVEQSRAIALSMAEGREKEMAKELATKNYLNSLRLGAPSGDDASINAAINEATEGGGIICRDGMHCVNIEKLQQVRSSLVNNLESDTVLTAQRDRAVSAVDSAMQQLMREVGLAIPPDATTEELMGILNDAAIDPQIKGLIAGARADMTASANAAFGDDQTRRALAAQEKALAIMDHYEDQRRNDIGTLAQPATRDYMAKGVTENVVSAMALIDGANSVDAFTERPFYNTLLGGLNSLSQQERLNDDGKTSGSDISRVARTRKDPTFTKGAQKKAYTNALIELHKMAAIDSKDQGLIDVMASDKIFIGRGDRRQISLEQMYRSMTPEQLLALTKSVQSLLPRFTHNLFKAEGQGGEIMASINKVVFNNQGPQMFRVWASKNMGVTRTNAKESRFRQQVGPITDTPTQF